MPDKIPDLLNALSGPVRAAIIGAVIALIRVMYDSSEPRLMRRLLESALCGAIALCVAAAAEEFGLSSGHSTFLGGAIGLLGADQVRIWARFLVQRRIDREGGK